MRRALLVEDSRTCAAVAMAVLREAGYAVERLSSITGARGALTGRPFNLAVVDAHLPMTDGGDTTNPLGITLAADIHAKHPTCRVLVWTFADAKTAALAQEHAVAIVQKDDITALVAAARGA